MKLKLPALARTATLARDSAGPGYSNGQLVLVAITSLVLYGIFVMVQTVRHRDYFLPHDGDINQDLHEEPPSVHLFTTVVP